MRIDKYLKVSRLIKRRTVAKEICQGDKIQLNGRVVKPAAEVKLGDVIRLEMGNHLLEVEVLAAPKSIRADEAHTLYKVLRDEKKNL